MRLPATIGFLGFVCAALTALPSLAAPLRPLSAEVVRALNSPSSVTIFALNPDLKEAHWYNTKLHGYRVLGKVTLSSPDRAKVAQILAKQIQHLDGWMKLDCFSPEHAVRIVSGEKVYELVICYHCQKIRVFRGNEQLSEIAFTGTPTVLNEALGAANVELPERVILSLRSRLNQALDRTALRVPSVSLPIAARSLSLGR